MNQRATLALEKECLEALRLISGQPEAGLALAYECYSKAKSADETRLMSLATGAIALGNAKTGRQREGLSWGKKSLSLANEAKDDYLRGRAHQNLGTLQQLQGNFESSVQEWRRALDYFRLCGSERSQAIVLSNLGNSHAVLAEFEEAIAYQRQAADLLERHGDKEFLSYVRITMAKTHLEGARHFENLHKVKAERLARKVFSIVDKYLAEDAKNVTDMARFSAFSVMGETHSFLHQHKEAESYLRQASEGFDSLGLFDLGALPKALWAKHLLKTSNDNRARALIEEALHATDDRAVNETVRIIYRCAVDIYRDLGDFRLALEAMEQFHKVDSEYRSTTAQVRAMQTEAVKQAAEHKLVAEMERLRTYEVQAAHRELLKHAEELEKYAKTDGLTGLANRRSFDETMIGLHEESKATGEPFSLLLCDIDHFKSINDRFSHVVGDEVLRQIAKVMRSLVPNSKLVARYGGEELAVLLPGYDESQSLALAEKLRQGIESTNWEEHGDGLRVTASFGVTSNLGHSPTHMIAFADEMLYKSKRNGRNQVNGLGGTAGNDMRVA